MIAQYTPYIMSVILIGAMAIEFRTGRIPNWLTLLPFVLFVAVVATASEPMAFAGQLGLGVVVFSLGIALFIFAGFGAGAVKLATGMALFIPLSEGLYALGVFLGSMMIGGFCVIQLRKLFGSHTTQWHVIRERVMPMSIPIALTALAIFFML